MISPLDRCACTFEGAQTAQRHGPFSLSLMSWLIYILSLQKKEFLERKLKHQYVPPDLEELEECQAKKEVKELPHHTVTVTDISEVDLAGQGGLRLGRNQVCCYPTTLSLSLSQTYLRWTLLVSVVSDREKSVLLLPHHTVTITDISGGPCWSGWGEIRFVVTAPHCHYHRYM